VRTLLVILLILAVAVIGGGVFVWAKIAGLKEALVSSLGEKIGAQIEVSSIDVDLWKGEIHAAGISLVNERPSAPWDKGSISQVTARFHLRDLFAGTLPISVEVASWNLVLNARGMSATPPPSSVSDEAPAAPESSSKGRVQVTRLTAHEGTAEIDLANDRKIIVRDVSFDSADNGAGTWNTQLRASSVTAGSLQADTTSMNIRSEPDRLTFSELRMQCGQGLITGDGEISLEGAHNARMNLKATDVPVAMLVAVQWQMELSGLVSGDLHYEGPGQDGSASGHLSVNHGKFNVLPWLGKVTALVGLQDISNLEIDKATSDFTWKAGALQLTNIDVRKDNVTRITGSVDVDVTGQVDGHLKLGLPSSVTSKWPQLQDKVFPIQSEDYNWADVHLTGTPDHLQEDLTPRLLAAGVGQGADLLNQAAQKATDLFNNFMGH
jgi:hypothetical protein